MGEIEDLNERVALLESENERLQDELREIKRAHEAQHVGSDAITL